MRRPPSVYTIERELLPNTVYYLIHTVRGGYWGVYGYRDLLIAWRHTLYAHRA